jgi:hypothetical protein
MTYTTQHEVLFHVEQNIKETDKAFCLRIGGLDRWFPKSVIRWPINDSTKVYVKSWFVEKMDEAGALFSDDKKQRLVLWRTWNKNKKVAMVIGLNPSTANADTNDPTIQRLIETLNELDFGGLRMVNLFTHVSSTPEVLKQIESDEQHDLGIIFGHGLMVQEIIFGWGNFKEAKDRAKKVIDFFPDALCFGMTKDGSPWHPMALMYNAVKPKQARLFKFRLHHPENNISNKKATKRDKQKDYNALVPPLIS